MSTELIISIISLLATSVIGAFTVIANIKISKINHLEDVHKYQKEITYFELQFKDEQWLYSILRGGDFKCYSKRSQRRIYKWWKKYQEKYNTVLLNPIVNYNNLYAQDIREKYIEEIIENGDEPNNDF